MPKDKIYDVYDINHIDDAVQVVVSFVFIVKFAEFDQPSHHAGGYFFDARLNLIQARRKIRATVPIGVWASHFESGR